MRSPILNKQRFVATRDLFNNRCRRRHPYATLDQGQFRDRDLRFTLWIILATNPIGIAGLLLAKLLNTCNSPLRNVSVIGWACVVMAASSGFRRNSCPSSTHAIEDASFVDAMLIGIAQIGALIPGVSRSGSTLTAALGFKRDEAARLSCLLGLPAIALAGFREMWELYKIHLDGHGWSVLLLGLIVASISAFFAIWGLMRILRNSRLGRS